MIAAAPTATASIAAGAAFAIVARDHKWIALEKGSNRGARRRERRTKRLSSLVCVVQPSILLVRQLPRGRPEETQDHHRRRRQRHQRRARWRTTTPREPSPGASKSWRASRRAAPPSTSSFSRETPPVALTRPPRTHRRRPARASSTRAPRSSPYRAARAPRASSSQPPSPRRLVRGGVASSRRF